LPLLDRKRRLQRLIQGKPGLLFAEHIETKDLFRAICDKDLEGIVGKYRHSLYASPPNPWVKILNPDYSQKRGRREMF
jgi:ATP-dependent DNA ligase